MRRREFITLVGGAATWPIPAHGQQRAGMRRIVEFTPLNSDDPEAQARNAAFLQALQESGWTVGRNVRIDYRWGGGDPDQMRRYATELAALAPDVILATGSPTIIALQQAGVRVPIVFVAVIDPVGAGFVDSLARPGGNVTGFTTHEYGTSAKFLELLKEIAPRVTRVAVFRDTTSPAGTAQLAAIQTAALSSGMELRPVSVRNAGEIEHAITAFAREMNGGLIVPASGLAIVHRELILELAARHRLPSVYPYRFYATDGGLISYGPDIADQFRRAAGYVDRILKGKKPAELPVQVSTRYELVINLKTARALGLDVPPTLLARADEVIE
jgi:putative ABC transport system substrate-binding protein